MWKITVFVRPAATAERMFCMFQKFLNLAISLTKPFTMLIKISITQTFIHKILLQGTGLET